MGKKGPFDELFFSKMAAVHGIIMLLFLEVEVIVTSIYRDDNCY